MPNLRCPLCHRRDISPTTGEIVGSMSHRLSKPSCFLSVTLR